MGEAPRRPAKPSVEYVMKRQSVWLSEHPEVNEESAIRKVFVDVLGKSRHADARILSQSEIDEAELLILSCEVADLKALMQADETPIYIKGLISAIFTDMKNGNSRTIESLRDRQYGGIAQRLEISGRDGAPINNVQISAEDARKMIAEINASC